jgi:hypothetical protein
MKKTISIDIECAEFNCVDGVTGDACNYLDFKGAQLCAF